MSHSPEPWIVRRSPILGAKADECFVQARRLDPKHPYDIQVLGEDHHESLYPPAMYAADCERIVACVNALAGMEAPDKAEKLFVGGRLVALFSEGKIEDAKYFVAWCSSGCEPMLFSSRAAAEKVLSSGDFLKNKCYKIAEFKIDAEAA